MRRAEQPTPTACPARRRGTPAISRLHHVLVASAVLAVTLTAVLLAPEAIAAASTGTAALARPPRRAYAPGKVVVGYATGSQADAARIARSAGAEGGGEALPTEPEAEGPEGIEAPLARSASVGGSAQIGGGSRRSHHLQTRQTRVLTLRRGVRVSTAIAKLRRRRGVAWAVPDYVAHAAGEYIPNDPGHAGVPGGWRELQWNFDGKFGVGAPEAWANLAADGNHAGQGVTVAVLDTGIAYANRGRFRRSPDFEASQFVKGYDFVRKDPFPNDRNGHGTFVAGTIAEATGNNKDLTGLAYGVRLMPVRVLDATGEGDASTIAKGVRFAVRHHAKVINLSLEFSGDVTAADVPELVSALAYAHRHGVVMVAAAGNEASTHIPYPARDKYVISVGASTVHGCLADYSNYGRGVALVAPGGGADANLPGDPNCHPGTHGRDIFQETFRGTSPRVFGMPGGYEGTSMAAPHVAATAALIIASGVLGSEPKPSAIRMRLIATARPLGDEADHLDYGHGLLDAAAATAPGGPGAVTVTASRRRTGGVSAARSSAKKAAAARRRRARRR